jgi:hypothetical protein
MKLYKNSIVGQQGYNQWKISGFSGSSDAIGRCFILFYPNAHYSEACE